MSTNDELAEKFIRKCEAEVGAQIDGSLSEILSGLLDKAYERGRREENEACAKMAEGEACEFLPKHPAEKSDMKWLTAGHSHAIKKIATAIRARIKKGE